MEIKTCSSGITVKELIEVLEQYDDETNIDIYGYHGIKHESTKKIYWNRKR